MKSFLTLVFAVFIGNLASLSVIEYWHYWHTERLAELEKQKLAELQRRREEQGAKIRQLLLNGNKLKGDPVIKDDAMPGPNEEAIPQQ